MRITVLMGGTSAERDVSLATGLRVAEALRSRGHQVSTVDTVRGSLSVEEEANLLAAGTVKTAPPSSESLARMGRAALPATVRVLPNPTDTDVAFLALHGGSGEDGTIQAILDLAGIPYTGSGHLGSALAMDKDLSKHLFRAEGVTTADWVMAPREPSPEFLARAVETLGLPVIVKPSKQGSTVGLSVVKEAGALAPAIAEAFRHDDEVMVEAFVAGRELTVGILGDEALPVGEIIPKHEIYDYECKYTAGMAVEVFPADITDAQRETAQEQARRAFQALKLRGYARIDFRMSEAGEMFCLEANTLPGMTATSLIPQAAAAAGIDFPILCERIVELALEAYGKR
ncbi:MAG TPA: D-alanine--D-alanine ligase [Gemmatimonadaceae bacterium]|nr:D-alanine--D-alanine ligase [Gemmatimonadaceae bacterium]